MVAAVGAFAGRLFERQIFAPAFIIEVTDRRGGSL
jgi:hypothetical protein